MPVGSVRQPDGFLDNQLSLKIADYLPYGQMPVGRFELPTSAL